jgi:type IV pilus assembly protein PilC
MFFSSQIGAKSLVGLCHRMATALQAGIDLRTVLAREADRSHGSQREKLLEVGRAVNQGVSLADALTATGDFFPALFHDMVGLGEQTGHLDAVLTRLAEHYQIQIDMRRTFIAATLWPMVQLAIAIVVIGGLIWLTDILREITGNKNLDLMGLGLVGTHGLMLYAIGVAGLIALLWITKNAMARGLVWTRPIQHFMLALPGIGKPLQIMALARLAWAMHITMYAGMEVRQALKLSLRSTQNARYTDQIPEIIAEISAGNSIHQAFFRAGGYPADFLDTVAVGEDSGRLVESMEILARQYQDQARSALVILTTLGGWGVWALVAALLIAVVFRLFSFYVNILSNAAGV